MKLTFACLLFLSSCVTTRTEATSGKGVTVVTTTRQIDFPVFSRTVDVLAPALVHAGVGK